MSLRFIYGRAGSGKTLFCLKEIKDRIVNGAEHPLLLLVPEQYTFQAERDLIKVLNNGGILKTEVLSFRRLAFRVFNEAGGLTYPHIHSAGKCMIIYRILSSIQKDLRVFAKAADRQGFVNTISTLITEFKRYNITPADLERTVEGLEENSLLKDKLSEINTIYSRFEQTIAARYRDTDDDLTLAAEKIKDTKLYDGAEIWIDGFAGFTTQEYKLIASLLCQAKRVNICLCADSLTGTELIEETDVFSAIKRTAKRLTSICRELGIEIENAVNTNGSTLPRFRNSRELSHLERNYSAYPWERFSQKTQDISLLSSANILAEIEEAAKDIVRLCRDKNYRYREIAVVMRNLDSYERLIEVIFDQYEIPYFLDKKVEINRHSLVRMILSMLEIFIQNWSYESVFSYLKTGLTGLDRKSIDRIENYVLACGIRGNRWIKEEEWGMSTKFLPDEQDVSSQEDILKEINRIRFQITEPLLEFRKRTKGRNEVAVFCTALFDFLNQGGVPERIEKLIDSFRNKGRLDLAKEYSQVWNIVMEVFDQIVEVMGNEKISLEKFFNILKIGFGEYQVGIIPPSVDQVLVGSVERTKSHKIKALYILGANDGIFPSASQEEGILSDIDRTVLSGMGIELAGDARTQAFDEQYLVYRVLTTAEQYLRISWPIADQEGRSMRPSVIIARLKKIFPKITVTSNLLNSSNLNSNIKQDEITLKHDRLTNGSDNNCEGIELPFEAKTPAFREMILAFRKKADGEDIPAFWENVYCWFSKKEGWQERCRTACRAFTYKNIAQPVSKDKIVALLGNPVYTSVSRLEKYTSCPFGFYVQYGLGARERTVYRLSPPDVGTFMHAVIERFSLLVSEQNLSWRDLDWEWCEAKVSEIVEEMLNKMQGSGLAGSKRYKALAIRLKRVVTRAVWLIAEHMKRSSFEPLGYEVGFGDKEEMPAIMLELDSGDKIKLTGRIDRVDALKTENGTYLRIVDYKSGSKDFKLADAYYGLQIQLLTYLDAMWDNPGFEIKGPVLPAGVLYFRIDDPLIRQKGSAEEIEKAIMKELKMKGLLLADVKLIKEMDKTIERSSLIIPASLNKDQELGRHSSVASLEHFKILRSYLRKLLQSLGEEIMRGNVEINPYKKKDMTSCKYCEFISICQFETSLPENSYRLLSDRKDDDIWELMTEKGQDEIKGGS